MCNDRCRGCFLCSSRSWTRSFTCPLSCVSSTRWTKQRCYVAASKMFSRLRLRGQRFSSPLGVLTPHSAWSPNRARQWQLARLFNPAAGAGGRTSTCGAGSPWSLLFFLLQLVRKVTHERRSFPWRLESAISFVCKRCFTPSPFLPSSFLFLCSLNTPLAPGVSFTSLYLGRLFVGTYMGRFSTSTTWTMARSVDARRR